MKSKKLFSRIRKVILKLIVSFFAVSIGLVIFFKFVPIPITMTMIGQRIQQGHLNYDWEPMENISDEMKIAVVAAEDQLFPEHHGFDIEAIKNALERNQKSGKKRGGSTISQQTAKNVFLWQGRSWLRKGLETYFTFLIETIWGKKRILEVYLNVAEMGPGTFGAQAAARRYYSIDAKKLNRSHAAGIAAILPSPRKWKLNPMGNYVARRKNHIQRQIHQLGGIAYLKSLNL